MYGRGTAVHGQPVPAHRKARHLRREHLRDGHGQARGRDTKRSQSKGVCKGRGQRGAGHLRKNRRGTFADGSCGQRHVFGGTRTEGERTEQAYQKELRAFRPHLIPDRGRKGDARVDDSQGHQGAAGGRQDTQRFRARLHTRRGCGLGDPSGVRRL